MEFKPKNIEPFDYVKGKIEKTNYIKFDKEKYLKPIIKYDAYKESGDIQGKIGELEIDFSYGSDSKIVNPNIRKIEKFILKNKEAVLDAASLLPKDYSLYTTTYIDKEDNSFESVHRPIERKIFINTPLLSINGIVSLLHEIGHENRDQTQTVFENIRDDNSIKRFKTSGVIKRILSGLSFRKPNIKDASRVLRDERDAWSFALQKIKPFMKDLNIDIKDLENMIHHEALYSYSWLIRDHIDI